MNHYLVKYSKNYGGKCDRFKKKKKKEAKYVLDVYYTMHGIVFTDTKRVLG